jgi:ubiquinone/menaquinone biosynthesis C-methylase UbiE
MNFNKIDCNIYDNYYDKYTSKNKIENLIVNNFIENLKKILLDINYKIILDAGCGAGYLTNKISTFKDCEIIGLDLSAENINKARINYPYKFLEGTIYKLPFDNNSIDIVTTLEVLEHLQEPELALEEIKRVTKKWVLLSVPVEPLWRILNIFRGKYIRSLGNTPGHTNHWTTKEFLKLVEKYFVIHKYVRPIPWIIVLCSL